MRIAIVGAGGVGGYFGARLQAAGSEVVFLARGAHLDALRTRGLMLESPKGDLHLAKVTATDNPAAIGEADVVLLTVKMYDLASTAMTVKPLVGRETVVVTLQNGVEAVDIAAREIGREHVAGGVAYIGAVIAEPGVIRHTAMDSLIFGELDGRRSERLTELAAAGNRAGFSARVSDDIEVDLWSKFVGLSVFSGMTSVTRAPLGVIRAHPDLLEMIRAASAESLAVAHAHGVAVPATLIDHILKTALTLPAGSKSSMLEDLERGRRLELPWLSGAVVRLGAAVGVPTPIHAFIATVLKPYVGGAPTAQSTTTSSV